MPLPDEIEVDAVAEWPWWALYTRHQHEKIVAEMLSAKGFEVFLPLYESMRCWKDRNKKLWLPLFPCYVFVRGEQNRRLQAVTTPGVHTILRNGERVAVIPEAEIEAIRKAVTRQCHPEPYPFLECGERVRVIRGSLKGIEGILIRKKSSYRLVLSLDLLAQSAAVEIDAAHVQPLAMKNEEEAFADQLGSGRFQPAFAQ